MQTAKDAKNFKSCGLDKKDKELIEIMKQNPFQNPPAYERLVGNLQEFYLRQINIQHRIIFQVIEERHVRVLRICQNY
ncbi:MAG: Txe/YoeB family addiction module toxin [Lachnospiraceae bacterium]